MLPYARALKQALMSLLNHKGAKRHDLEESLFCIYNTKTKTHKKKIERETERKKRKCFEAPIKADDMTDMRKFLYKKVLTKKKWPLSLLGQVDLVALGKELAV